MCSPGNRLESSSAQSSSIALVSADVAMVRFWPCAGCGWACDCPRGVGPPPPPPRGIGSTLGSPTPSSQNTPAVVPSVDWKHENNFSYRQFHAAEKQTRPTLSGRHKPFLSSVHSQVFAFLFAN